MSDDGYIYLRVVKQVLAGQGPVFNAGERVEAATGPLWVLMLAIADVILPVQLEWIAVLLGLGLTLGGISLAMVGAHRLARSHGAPRLWIPIGAAVLVAYAPNWTYATGGLEGGLALTWLGTCLILLAVWATADTPLSPLRLLVVGLGPLIRPDLTIFTVLFLAVLLFGAGRRAGGRELLRILGLVLALPVAYEVFRLGFYGSPVPNPAIAKEAGLANWKSGWDYLRTAVGPYRLWFPLVVLALGAYVPLLWTLVQRQQRRSLVVVVAFGVGGVVHTLYVVRVGGDFMHARLLLPSLYAIAAPVAVAPLRRRYLLASLVLPWAVVALFFLRSPSDKLLFFYTTKRRPVTVQDFGWTANGHAKWHTSKGVYYGIARIPARPAPGRDGAVASYGIGISSYAFGTDVYVLDALGLADPFTARLELLKRGYPGHEKPLPPPWILARLIAPGSTVDESLFPRIVSFGITPLDHPERAPFPDRVATARQVLECRDIKDLFRSYTGRLSAGRFIDNIGHAIGRWRLRIPPEPADALHRFCKTRG